MIPLAIIGITLTLAAEDVDYSGCKTFLDVITAPVQQRHHTAATLARWKTWAQAHPKWKYHPTHLVIAKLRFECPNAPNTKQGVPVPPEAILLPPAPIQNEIALDWTQTDTTIDLPEPLLGFEQPTEDYQSVTTGYSTPYSDLGGGYLSTSTQQPPVPTPELESLYLLGTGLIGLVGIGRIYK